MDTTNLIEEGSRLVARYGLKLIFAIVIWLVGSRIIKILSRIFVRFLQSRGVNDTLRPFLINLGTLLLNILLIVLVFSALGVGMSSFLAIFGAAGLAIGLSLSGMLQNFAGGVVLLVFKPFKVGDSIELMGQLGTVSSIQIFHTSIITPDNKRVILPNGGVAAANVINYSWEENRRVDWSFNISYGEDVEKAKSVLREAAHRDARILKDPAVFIAIEKLADSGITFTMRAWVKNDDYWDVFFDMNEKTYSVFSKENISIPFPQMDVRLFPSEAISKPAKSRVATLPAPKPKNKK